MEYMLMPYRKLYRLIEGRSGRREFWLFFLFNIIVVLGSIALIVGISGVPSFDAGGLESAFLGAGMGLMLILIIPLYIWYILSSLAIVAVSIRRLHDANLTGWIYLALAIGAFIPFIQILFVIGYFILMALPGTKGPNKYGEDPEDPVLASAFE